MGSKEFLQMKTSYIITHSNILNNERKNNWHCTIKSDNKDDKRITIDIWGHDASRKEVEDLALEVVDVLNKEK
jgi:hypothetical protein